MLENVTSTPIIPVTHALYRAFGMPPLTKKVPLHKGFCGACKVHDLEVTEARKILSKSFGSWANISVDSRNRRNLCVACGWAYQFKDTIFRPSIVTQACEVIYPTPEEMRSYLRSKLRSDCAVLLPVSGKKSVAPTARWGMLSVDGGPIRWDKPTAQIASALLKLRSYGYNETDLSRESPSDFITDSLTAAQWEQVQVLWRIVNEARNDKIIYPALIKLTRKKF